MAEADKDQKTQEPTAKRLEDARKKGDVPTAPEMRHAIMFGAMFMVLGSLGLGALTALARMAVRIWGSADQIRLDPLDASRFAIHIAGELLMAIGPVLAVLFGFGLLVGFSQGMPTIAWARVTPKWSKLNPFTGLGRIFGKQGLVEFAKTLAKSAAVITIGVIVLWPHATAIDQLVGMEPIEIARTAAALVVILVKCVLVLVGAIAAFDFIYQRRAFLAKMRMTLQEVKDEHKESDGDPKVKARQRQIGIQRSRRRMMAAVPTASVVVTNPTHYAVALKYEHGTMRAPIVVAKGVDAIALKIREVAGAADVPIIESPPLARALYASAEIDRPIPVEHYAAVAEIISYVMSLARKRMAA
jgi:flagellar biosynthetic protein FlhB